MNPQAVTVPVWLISVLISVIGSGFVVWGALSFLKSEVSRSKTDIESLWDEISKLRNEKVSKDEFQQTLAWLDRIEKKLDSLIKSK